MTAVAPAFAVRTGGSRQLAGTGTLLRFALRRDRSMIPLWVAINALMVLSMPGTLKGLYGTAAQRADLADQMATNSSLRAMVGPVFGESLGALTAWRIGVYAAAARRGDVPALVVRHTRDEEESGRQELISSAMVGRRAPLTAALLTAAVANAVLALVIRAVSPGRAPRARWRWGWGSPESAWSSPPWRRSPHS